MDYNLFKRVVNQSPILDEDYKQELIAIFTELDKDQAYKIVEIIQKHDNSFLDKAEQILIKESIDNIKAQEKDEKEKDQIYIEGILVNI